MWYNGIKNEDIGWESSLEKITYIFIVALSFPRQQGIVKFFLWKRLSHGLGFFLRFFDYTCNYRGEIKKRGIQLKEYFNILTSFWYTFDTLLYKRSNIKKKFDFSHLKINFLSETFCLKGFAFNITFEFY